VENSPPSTVAAGLQTHTHRWRSPCSATPTPLAGMEITTYMVITLASFLHAGDLPRDYPPRWLEPTPL